MRSRLRPVLHAWVRAPGEMLERIVDRRHVERLVVDLVGSRSIHRMNERQFLVVRLFMLDRWLQTFNVTI
jgi:hypothetical protein